MAISLIQILPIYLIGCLGVGIIAKTKGRSFWGWALLSLIITPIIAGVIVLIMKPLFVIRKAPPLM
jgi:predicted lipid-binding transport protein (Tim44 family)